MGSSCDVGADAGVGVDIGGVAMVVPGAEKKLNHDRESDGLVVDAVAAIIYCSAE
jgi:hypothetical protein